MKINSNEINIEEDGSEGKDLDIYDLKIYEALEALAEEEAQREESQNF